MLSFEYGLSPKHLSHDAADGPHVNGAIVLGRVEQELWCSVPPCGHVVGHDFGQLLIMGCGSCQSKVTDLCITVTVHEYISWFEISVKDTGTVKVFHTS